jgi:hypothetical protein
MPIRFQVDADFYDHPKTTGMSDSAFALWVRAGSFSAAKLTDGFIAEDVIVHTLRYDAEVADELVRHRLWSRVKGGYRFRQWDERNLTRARVEKERTYDRERKREERKSTDAARKRRDRRAEAMTAGQSVPPQVEQEIVRPDSGRIPNGFRQDSERNPPVSVSVSVSESVSGSGHGALRNPQAGPHHPGPEPPRKCPDHKHSSSTSPCGACFEQRRAHGEWEAARNEWHRTAPKCRTHPGQLASNCSGCAADRKARAGDP